MVDRNPTVREGALGSCTVPDAPVSASTLPYGRVLQTQPFILKPDSRCERKTA